MRPCYLRVGLSVEVLEFRDLSGADRGIPAGGGSARRIWLHKDQRKTFRNRLFAYVILMMMPYQVTLVPNYLVLNWMKLLDTNWSIWLPGIFSPFSVYLITKYMRRIPVPLIEAAKIDGANEFQVFTKICIPICKGVITTCAILVFMDYWNMVEQPLLFLTIQINTRCRSFCQRSMRGSGTGICSGDLLHDPKPFDFLIR